MLIISCTIVTPDFQAFCESLTAYQRISWSLPQQLVPVDSPQSSPAESPEMSLAFLIITDAMIQDFHIPSDRKKEIIKTIERHRPLIEDLKSEFRGNPRIKQNFRALSQSYSAWRRSKNDGNSFFRCLGVVLLEHYSRPDTNIQIFHIFMSKLMNGDSHFSLKNVDPVILSELRMYLRVIKELYDMRDRGDNAFQSLQYLLQRQDIDKAIIVAMRHYAASYLLMNCQDPDLAPFIDNSHALIAEIKENGRDAEGLMLIAAARCFEIVLHVFTADTKSSDIIETVYGPAVQGSYPSISLILISGHYNYLVKREVDRADRYDFANNIYNSYRTGDSALGCELFPH